MLAHYIRSTTERILFITITIGIQLTIYTPQYIRIRHNRSFLYHTQRVLPIRFKRLLTVGMRIMLIRQ